MSEILTPRRAHTLAVLALRRVHPATGYVTIAADVLRVLVAQAEQAPALALAAGGARIAESVEASPSPCLRAHLADQHARDVAAQRARLMPHDLRRTDRAD